jgi:hypothetical protein
MGPTSGREFEDEDDDDNEDDAGDALAKGPMYLAVTLDAAQPP